MSTDSLVVLKKDSTGFFRAYQVKPGSLQHFLFKRAKFDGVDFYQIKDSKITLLGPNKPFDDQESIDSGACGDLSQPQYLFLQPQNAKFSGGACEVSPVSGMKIDPTTGEITFLDAMVRIDKKMENIEDAKNQGLFKKIFHIRKKTHMRLADTTPEMQEIIQKVQEHPEIKNVVKYYGQTGIMEAGVPLDLNTHIEIKESVHFMSDIGLACKTLFEAKILQADLKPGNVVKISQEGKENYSICDYGGFIEITDDGELSISAKDRTYFPLTGVGMFTSIYSDYEIVQYLSEFLFDPEATDIKDISVKEMLVKHNLFQIAISVVHLVFGLEDIERESAYLNKDSLIECLQESKSDFPNHQRWVDLLTSCIRGALDSFEDFLQKCDKL